MVRDGKAGGGGGELQLDGKTCSIVVGWWMDTGKGRGAARFEVLAFRIGTLKSTTVLYTTRHRFDRAADHAYIDSFGHFPDAFF